MKYQKIAKLGNILHRFSTLLSLVLTLYFFFTDATAGMLVKALYALWMVVAVFGSFRVISDIVGGERRRQRSFMTMMEQWEAYQGGPGSAARTFLLLSIAVALVKLAVPTLIYLF